MNSKDGPSDRFTRLKDGSWGIHSRQLARHGDRVRVTRKDGSTRQVTVDEVLWHGVDQDGEPAVIMSILGEAPPRSSGSKTKTKGPSEKQLAYARQLIHRLDQVAAFDSIGGTGQTHAARARKDLAAAKTASDVSKIIDGMKSLLDDEM